jgi:putative transposase
MPRAGRNFEEGRIYHAYNRVTGGWPVFENARLALRFTRLLRRVVLRDDLTVFAWCLLANHYHLVVRQSAAPLSRSMKSLQQSLAQTRNLQDHTYGPLWQGRFKARDVTDERYLMQVVAYVHLNPVKAGLVQAADEYRWSGHQDMVGNRRPPIVAVDDVLALYGSRRRQALRGYRTAMESVADAEWSGERPGWLPWWRLGRPTEEDRLRLRKSAFTDADGRSTARWRPTYEAKAWLEAACGYLGVDWEELAGRGRDPEVVKLRDLIGLVGIERFGVRAIELARELGKSRDGVSRWYRRGVVRRAEDPEFAAMARGLDGAMSEDR